MIVYRIVLILIASAFAFTFAHAQKVPQNYEAYAKHADKVVHGKVVASQPIMAYRGAKELSCGIFMEIEVTKSIRGGTDNFLLYSTNKDVISNSADQEYFIFAFKNEKYAPGESNEDFVLCEGTNSVMKNIAPFEYISNSHVQRIFPLRKEERTLTDWMQIADRLSNAELPEGIEKQRVSSSNINIIEEMSLTQFMAAFMPEENQ
ncbi:hypothetical protein [Pseudemcibacter aquimaris]|uniref:hypothetical protein n=1 Tax=Pseudemcibacter aquimaris TaxID=2857064 RepID=UPI0020133555|nr:hypothetical protein [Pseudemcibacter aquimaris]MCC3859857.1 hypothetical protein [Pseudemcibacter aquimaris]WDU57189.1 hypothetical protein KW060_08260 [Pseudemcibacter aquimaris]